MMVKVTTRPSREEFTFDSLDEFFKWLYETYHLTTMNFYGSSGFHANKDQSIMTFVTWGIYLIVEVER